MGIFNSISYEPTLEEIRFVSAQIRNGWSEATRLNRLTGLTVEELRASEVVQPPHISFTPEVNVVLGIE